MSALTSSSPIWIGEPDVAALLDLGEAIDQLRAAFRTGQCWSMDKTMANWPGGTLHALGGGLRDDQVVGTKTWVHTASGAEPNLLLWSALDGTLLAVVESFVLGQLRTAAITGLATDALAPSVARSVALIGTGKQALSQLAAVLAVRQPERVSVWSPNELHRNAFVRHARAVFPDVRIDATATKRGATESADIVTVVTRATVPVLSSADVVAPAVLVNSIGAIGPGRSEVAEDLVAACDIVVSDSPSAARTLSNDLDHRGDVVDLPELIASGRQVAPGRALFKAMGLGAADVVLGTAALRRCRDARLGTPLPPRAPSSPSLTWRTQ